MIPPMSCTKTQGVIRPSILCNWAEMAAANIIMSPEQKRLKIAAILMPARCC